MTNIHLIKLYDRETVYDWIEKSHKAVTVAQW